ncbi:MAG: anti-sigma factor, partial [Cryobacterium sp.]
MTHIDPDDLAVIALDLHEVTALEQDHIDSCAECASELLALERTVQAGRAAPAVQLEQPDPAVWARLHQQLGLSAKVAELPAKVAELPAKVAELPVEAPFAAPVLEAVPAAPA